MIVGRGGADRRMRGGGEKGMGGGGEEWDDRWMRVMIGGWGE